MLSFLINQCSHKQNYDEAEIVQKNDSTFIKLKGKRERMAHDLNSVKSDHTYEDSVLIQIPHLLKGEIEGESLPVKKGTYKFKGQIVVEDTKLRVELVVIDTDGNVDRPYTWNGEYRLVKEILQ
jgi:hypothetical protein